MLGTATAPANEYLPTAILDPESLVEQLPNLRRYARFLTRDPERADDLVQACLLRALDNLHRFQVGTNLRAWLLTMIRNLYINELRRNSPIVSWTSEEKDIGDQLTTAPCQTDTVALRELEQAILQLPREQREVLALVVLEGLQYNEAAEIMGVPIGTVRSRLNRARRKLLPLFGEDLPNAGNAALD